MIYRIKLPQLGETMVEGTLATWHKQVGDTVHKGDPLFCVETDKTAMDVESAFAGQLQEICCPVGSTVPVGTVIAVLKGASS
jgi:pyruvate/2-oxoglutarate dehydrogenase complex dihydrolipoamide acyltransferase (E2) component